VRAANKPAAAEEAKMISAYFTDALLPPADTITMESYGDSPENHQIEIILSSRKRHMGWKYDDILHNQHNALVITVEVPGSKHQNKSPSLPARLPGLPSVKKLK
jgi:hypothetical protein